MNARRRLLLSALAGTALASTAIAAPTPRIARVVAFGAFPTPEIERDVRARLGRRFAADGFVDGRNLALSLVKAPGVPETDERLAREVVNARPDVICVTGVPWTRLFMRLTREIPIVFVNVDDPVGMGLVASLARPGGNVTGASNRHLELLGKRVELLKELRPTLRRAAVIQPGGPSTESVRREARVAAARLAIEVQVPDLDSPVSLKTIIDAVARARAEGVLVNLGAPAVASEIRQFLARSSIPAVYTDERIVRAGGLASIGEARGNFVERMADVAVHVLRGRHPRDIPVDQLSVVHFALNLRTAAAMGLKVPEAVRLRADEVIG